MTTQFFRVSSSTKLLLVSLVLSLFLIACGSDTPDPIPVDEGENVQIEAPTEAADPEPTEEPVVEPTAEPEPTAAPTDEPAAEPTEASAETSTDTESAMDEEMMEAGEKITSTDDGFVLIVPEGYTPLQSGPTVTIVNPEENAEAYISFTANVDTGDLDANIMVESMLSGIVGEDGTIGQIEPITIHGSDGVSAQFELEENGEMIKGSLIYFVTDVQSAFLLGGAPADYWDAKFGETYTTIASSIELFEPGGAPGEMMAEGENEGENEMEDGENEVDAESASMPLFPENATVSEKDGYALIVPDGFETTEGESFFPGASANSRVFSMVDPNAEYRENLIMLVTSVETENNDPATAIDQFLNELAGDVDEFSVGETSPISINGIDGSTASFSVPENDETIRGNIIALPHHDMITIFFGGSEESHWNDQFKTAYDEIAASIQLFAPVADGNPGETEPEEAEVSVPAMPATGAGGEGFACAASTDVGLSCINADGSWAYFTEDNSDLSNNYVGAMTTCPDNRIVATTFSEINIFDGAAFEVIEGDWGFSSPDEVACGPDGSIWVVYFEGASVYDGSAWTNFEFSDFSTGDSGLVGDVAVGEDGTAWVLTSNGISAYQNGAWTLYEEGAGLDDLYFFNHLGIGADGLPVASFGDGFLRFDGSAWSAVEAANIYGMYGLTPAADGAIWFETLSDGLVQYANGSFTPFDRDSGLSSNAVTASAIDESGRLWVGTEYGLNVITGDGVQAFTMANSDILDQQIDELIVIGDGPTLPTTVEKGNGSISGFVQFEDGTPLANARVEICAEGLGFSYYGDTPCSDQALFVQGTTDGDGNFSIGDIPVGYYITVIEVETDGWAQVVGEFGFLAERLLISEGENTDIGQITIEADE